MLAPTRGTKATQSTTSPYQAKSAPFFQPKLSVNTPGDAHEQEADRVADQVIRMRQGDVPIVQRKPLKPVTNVMRACTECEKEKMQRKETGGGDASGKSAPSIVSDVLSSGGGQPMESGTRQFMESRFGQDFSQVRIHTDSRAGESASAIQAQAYTSGRDVVFGSGEYQLGSEEGRRLLAHELVHVGQQKGVNLKDTVKRTKKCEHSDSSDAVIIKHSANKQKIEKPGDEVEFRVEFACFPKYGGFSKFKDSNQREFSRKSFESKSQTIYTRKWDGKRPFKDVGTYTVDDGNYTHEIENLKYANKGEVDLFATKNLVSPSVEVKIKGAGGASLDTEKNIKDLSIIIRSEMEEGDQDEKESVAWAVRNQMLRLNTSSVKNAKDAFGDAFGMKGNAASDKIAGEILKKPMTNDKVSGAIKWFSPKRMGDGDQACPTGQSCGGGVISVSDLAGKTVKRHAPSFYKTMTQVKVSNVRDFLLMLFKLK